MKALRNFLTLGEAMVELAPTGNSLYRKGFAGDTLNTAWYLRAYLPDSWNVGYVTALGDDPLSSEMSTFIQENGIDTTRIKHLAGERCGLYLISLENGERSFSYWRENSAARKMLDEKQWLESTIKNADKLFLSGISIAILPPVDRENLLVALAEFSANGGEISFDPNIRPKLWENASSCRYWVTEFAGISDTILPSFDDEQALFSDATPEDTCARYWNMGPKEVVVKNSSHPVTYCQSDKMHTITVPSLAKPVDSTGAGDSFNGAYLASIAIGCTQERSILNAIELSARVINTRGALIEMSELAAITRDNK